jgi:hypothetical protein
MKVLIVALFFVVVVSGCASSTPKPLNNLVVLSEAIKITQDSNIILIDIPSHGSIPDALSIAANGGGGANQLRQSIEKVYKAGGGNILITSSNPALPKAHISGAMSKLDSKIENVTIIYAGDQKYSDSIKTKIENNGGNYKFINKYKKM